MRHSIAAAVALLIGAGTSTAGALTVPSPYFGSDVLYNVTNGAIAGAGLTPTNAYVGGGTTTGQLAIATRTAASALQQTEPIANLFTSPICSYGLASGATGVNTNNTSGVVIGLDAVAVLASTASGAAPAVNGAVGPTGDNTGLGLAYSGSAVFGAGGTGTSAAQNWKYVLALVYGGKDLTTGVVDCGQAARLAVVNNWSALFQGSPANPASATCGDSNHTSAGANVLWHAFRRDDGAGVASVFASLIGLSTPSQSQQANNGFGTSPYCNAINWDAATGNGSTCVFGAHDQWTGPGGIVDPQSAWTIGASSAGAAGSGNHRRPPVGTWGDAPDPSQNTTTSADVLPTDQQDNDPVRRKCIGSNVGSASRAAEEVCNIEGTLGLVLPIPTSVFVSRDLGLQQYPTAKRTTFITGTATQLLNCAPFSNRTHKGECPNGDTLQGGFCAVPLNGSASPGTGTSQVLTGPGDRSVGVNRAAAATADGRAFNLFLRDGTNTDGSVAFIKQTVHNGTTTPITRDFIGGFGRIHTVATIFNGSPTSVGCQETAVDDQLGCLAAADPCSIAVAGDSGESWNTRPDGTLTPPSTVASALTDGLRIEQISPAAATVQNLGVQATASGSEYQLSRKLLFGSVIGFANINAGTAGQTDTATGELALGQWEAQEANIAPLLAADGFFTLGAQSGQLGIALNGGSANTPFCEDFNQQLVCGSGAGGNDNACARNPSGIPAEANTDPTQSTTSTVCGNGVQEAFEECDPGAGATAATSTCTTACRCAGAKSYLPNGTGGYSCQ